MDEFQIIETTKSKPSAIFGGHRYRQHRINKENVVTWLCCKEKSEKCRGTLKTTGSTVLSASEHKCKSSLVEVEIQYHQQNAKKRARETDQHISEIYKEEMGPLFDRGYDFVADVPLLYSMKSSLYRNRRQGRGVSAEPKSANEIEIPESVLLMLDGSSFLLADNKNCNEDRLICFATTTGREIISNANSFFMDGTFKCCSKQFSQLYTIHADIGSNLEETNIVPTLFALLKNKTGSTYERLFTLLKTNNWNPTSVTIDFEQAVIIAMKKVFPDIVVYGCHFHFNQCLWRKVQELGLTTEYKTNEEIRRQIRMCAALAYLPVEDIDEGWLCIQEDSPRNDKLQQFYDYFVDQWLENRIITTKMWNCHNRLHRTNNAVEGWNNRLKHAVNRFHPRIFDLINCLKTEA